MSNSLDLLEIIGQTASLRYAAPTELNMTLEREEASEALKAAVIRGDLADLSKELDIGDEPTYVPQVIQTFWPTERG